LTLIQKCIQNALQKQERKWVAVEGDKGFFPAGTQNPRWPKMVP